MSDLIDLRRLQHMVFLAESLHFSRAAERANLSQTAFSRSIQSLEQELGLRLFDRGTRFVALTASGAQLVEHAREVLSQVRHLKIEAQELLGGTAGRLSFGVSQLVSSELLQQWVDYLQPVDSQVQLDIEVNHWEALSELLLAERIEFFVANADLLASDPRFMLTPLQTRPASIYCRAGHPILHQETFEAAQMLTYPWASARFNHAVAYQLRQLLQFDEQQQLPIQLNCSDLGLLRHRAFNSDCLLVTWQHWLEEDLRAGRMIDLQFFVCPPDHSRVLGLSCSLVQLAGRSLSPLAKRAVTQLLCD